MVRMELHVGSMTLSVRLLTPYRSLPSRRTRQARERNKRADAFSLHRIDGFIGVEELCKRDPSKYSQTRFGYKTKNHYLGYTLQQRVSSTAKSYHPPI